MGSLVAALGSFLDARSHQGEWCLRIDDIDPPRHDKASFESIPRCLESHGLTWDGPIIFQSQRREAHEDACPNSGMRVICSTVFAPEPPWVSLAPAFLIAGIAKILKAASVFMYQPMPPTESRIYFLVNNIRRLYQ